MVIYCDGIGDPACCMPLRGMFEARKRVFVDLLGWDVPVLEGRYEVDQFDDGSAVYLIVTDEDGRHAGSARLLSTVRPHILGSLFPELCAAAPPRGPDLLEITRFCLDPRSNARQRLDTRNVLVSALVAYALDHGVSAYTGVAEMGWLQQILAFGWNCRPLGLPRTIAGRMLGALRIEIASDTPALLAANGIYRPEPLQRIGDLEAA
ncbi:MAG: acyl-homoserine-lactone synthase [Allosphingosinicella sp.]|uniref:acyl-homoserine-lactone synthase n=1 Tax=Allosphingosinicella sp. TaxID=2823234 RepID=UPI0039515481